MKKSPTYKASKMFIKILNIIKIELTIVWILLTTPLNIQHDLYRDLQYIVVQSLTLLNTLDWIWDLSCYAEGVSIFLWRTEKQAYKGLTGPLALFDCEYKWTHSQTTESETGKCRMLLHLEVYEIYLRFCTNFSFA